MFEKINSHNEWDKIKEIIVGTGKNTTATLTWKRDQEIDQKKTISIRNGSIVGLV